MTIDEAKEIFRTQRPGRDDEVDPARLNEALDLLQRDPASTSWCAAERDMDTALRKTLQSVTPPPGLREAILAHVKTTPFPSAPTTRSTPSWWAAAAVLVALLGLILFGLRTPEKIPLATLTDKIPGLADQHQHDFGSKTGDLQPVRAWLAAHGGAADFRLPPGLTHGGAVGCEIVRFGHTPVAVLCFHLADGRAAHLYLIDRARLNAAPAEGTPTVSEIDGVAMASWSDGNLSYFLAERGNPETIRQLL